MIINGSLAAVVQILLAGLAYWALGGNEPGALAKSFPESVLVQRMLAMLIAWLAGILCFLAGYWMRGQKTVGRAVISVAWLTILAAIWALGAFLPLEGENFSFFLQALALPFAPLLFMLGAPMGSAGYSVLAVFAPLLMLAGMQLRLGPAGKRKFALGMMMAYLALLLFVPVVGLILGS